MEENFLLPGYACGAGSLILAALIAVLNAFLLRRLRILIAGIAIPVLVYITAAVIVPWYVTTFIVKPNELGRETPYIEHNIVWTRRAFAVDRIEQRNFAAENTVEAFDLQNNRVTLDNIRLWDWRALQDTLKQIQAIRTYYDFPDVDVDRYPIGAQGRQVMIAARELNLTKLPAASRNWINQRLIYTHGYGRTIKTSHGCTPEGTPPFTLSTIPRQSPPPDPNPPRPPLYLAHS